MNFYSVVSSHFGLEKLSGLILGKVPFQSRAHVGSRQLPPRSAFFRNEMEDQQQVNSEMATSFGRYVELKRQPPKSITDAVFPTIPVLKHSPT